ARAVIGPGFFGERSGVSAGFPAQRLDVGEYPERVGMRAPGPERRGHRLDIGPRGVAVLDRPLSHRRGEQTVGVRLAPLDGPLARGVAPHARGDLEARDAGRVEQRAQLPAHLWLAAVSVPPSRG